MKIAVATMNGGLDDNVAPIFGRCKTYTFVEVKEEEIKDSHVEQNEFADATGGAGIQAAQLIARKGAEAIIAGNFGPNASTVLSQAGVKMIPAQGTVKDVAIEYAKGSLAPQTSQNTPGMQGMQQGMGGGMRRMSPGMGRGMGRGMGMRSQQPTQQPMGQPRPSTSGMSKEQQMTMLENQVRRIEQQLEQIKKSIKELKNK